MNFKLINAYIIKRIIKICLKQGRIRWLNVEEKKQKKLKRKLKKEEEEEDSFLFINALFKYFLKRAFFYSAVSKFAVLPSALSIFF